MPNPGQANNPSGANGLEEPAYGALQREKNLERAAPVGSPPGVGAPRRSQRRAVRGQRPSPSPSGPHPSAGPLVQGEQDAFQFWQAVLGDPASSPLAREYAQAALNGA